MWEAVEVAACHRLYWPAQLRTLLQHMNADTAFSLKVGNSVLGV